jgi:hypothetical protein
MALFRDRLSGKKTRWNLKKNMLLRGEGANKEE